MANIFEEALSKKTVFCDRDIMTPHYAPKKLPFRENQISEMTSTLSVLIESKRADNLFIYGKTGTGKTVSTKHVLQQLCEYADQKKKSVRSTYLNCRSHNSKYKIIIKILKSFFPDKDFVGYSGTFVYDKLIENIEESQASLVIALDEIDKVKDLDEMVYALTRCNDDMDKGSISLVGISNNLFFKDRLDPRTRSSLCEKELVFPPYNAEELSKILSDRVKTAFKEDVVEESAISIASAIAAQESGDARTAVMLMLRAGEIADKKGLDKITDVEVKRAKRKVEEEIIFNMVSTLPEQQQLVLYAIARLTLQRKGIKRISRVEEEPVLVSGEIYDEYSRIAKEFKGETVSMRWCQQYVNELEMYGLIATTESGKGFRGNTRLIKLGFDAKKIKTAIEKEIGFSSQSL